MYDVLIIGAGPSGSAAASALAQRGLSVLLVDKATFPRDKTCGDALSPRALLALDRMGVLPAVRNVSYAVHGYQLVAPNGRQTHEAIPGNPHQALMVPRRVLDDLLLRHAIAQGAQFEEGTLVDRFESQPDGMRVHVQHPDGASTSLLSRVVVIATGASISLLERSGLSRRQGRTMLARRAYMEDVAGLADVFQLRFDSAVMPGYGWIFPVTSTVANVGVCYHPSRHSPPNSREAFDRFAQQPRLRPYLGHARLVDGPRGYPIRVDFLTTPTVAPRVLLVGEAAGLVNPLTGEGIDYALESGQLAADHLADCLASDDLSEARLSAYDAALRLRFERLFRVCLQINDWLVKPKLLNALILGAELRPDLRHTMAEVVLGSSTHHAGWPTRLLRSRQPAVDARIPVPRR